MNQSKFFASAVVIFLALSVSSLVSGLYAQVSKVILTQAGSMTLSGTSTLHDWMMNGTFRVEGNFNLDETTRDLKSLNGLKFCLPVENLKSDKKKLDETAYKALKTDKYKEIYFTMTSATVHEMQNNKYQITAVGDLTIAGVTKPITMKVYWTLNEDNTITCTGIQKLRMTDYQVQPPGFLGIMKAGDEIALDFAFQIKT